MLGHSDQYLTSNDLTDSRNLHIVNAAELEETTMHGRPKLGKHRMVTVATCVEPDEVQMLRRLADECGMSLCGYMRELIRLELGRARRCEENS
jgi:hypothetical protein